MKTYHALGIVLAGIAVATGGCSVRNVGGNPSTRSLLARSSVTIPPGEEWLPFVFEAFPGSLVNVTVTANVNLADPDFWVVQGNVNVDEFEDVPIGQVEIVAEDKNSAQEFGSFTPEEYGEFTLFIRDANDFPDATFSIAVNQEN
ncbi:MAG TPA: hypothetical protein VM243_09740 [Phycisphaerae bacterium]|nr:hypothetical protein [Phycisphaerae bacterium]